MIRELNEQNIAYFDIKYYIRIYEEYRPKVKDDLP